VINPAGLQGSEGMKVHHSLIQYDIARTIRSDALCVAELTDVQVSRKTPLEIYGQRHEPKCIRLYRELRLYPNMVDTALRHYLETLMRMMATN